MPNQRSCSGTLFDSRGAILLITLLFLLLLTILGTSSIYLAFTEAVLSINIESDARAFYAAESGISQGLYWFNHPDKFGGVPADFFRRRQIGDSSFFSEEGISQYTGTSEAPDLVYSMMNNTLKVYAPASPGAICTLESSGESARIKRVVTVELYDNGSRVRLLTGSWRVD